MDDIARSRLNAFKARDDLTDIEKISYFAKALERQKESDVTDDELMHICVMLMHASVDTTASKISWNVLQLALNQDVQERVYQQIKQAVDQEGGALTPALFARTNLPLLAALVRETHRCTPSVPLSIVTLHYSSNGRSCQ